MTHNSYGPPRDDGHRQNQDDLWRPVTTESPSDSSPLWPTPGSAEAQPPSGWPDAPQATGGPSPEASAEPERFHPAYMVMHLLRSLRGFIFPIAIILISGGGRGEIFFTIIAFGIALLTALNAVMNWWFTTYELTDRSFHLRTGWLNRQERSVPLERIQSIDLQETPLARILGVVALKIETAAAGANRVDISLDAVSREEAASLQERLVTARARLTNQAEPLTPTETMPSAPSSETIGDATPSSRFGTALSRPQELGFGDSGELIREISQRELIIAGMTSGRVGPALAIVGFIFQFGTDLFPEAFFDRITGFLPGLDFTTGALVLFALALLAWVISIIGTVLAFSGFTLRRDGEHLHIATGLLDRRRTTVPLRRIQAVGISEGWLRQPFGYASLRFDSAGYSSTNDDSGTLFPLIKRTEIAELLRQATPGFAADLADAEAQGERLPTRARRRYAMGIVWDYLFVVVAAVGIAAIIPRSDWWWGLWLLVLVPVAALYGLMSFRETFWFIDDDERYIVRTRGVSRTTTIVPKMRIQQRHILQNPLQRRADLASFRVNYAGAAFSGGVGVNHMTAQQADDMASRLALGPVKRRRRRAKAANAEALEPALLPPSL